jgi:hypothetical protein
MAVTASQDEVDTWRKMKILQVETAEPRFMRPLYAQRYTGVSRDLIQVGIDRGYVKAFWLCNPMRKGERAYQLIDRESLVWFIENFGSLCPDAEVPAQKTTTVPAKEAAAT